MQEFGLNKTICEGGGRFESRPPPPLPDPSKFSNTFFSQLRFLAS